MSDHSSLRSWMDSAGLGHLTSHFISEGVTEQNFPRLQLADFDRLGVRAEGGPGTAPHAAQTRQKLFKLIQVVRAESEREAQQNAAAAATLAANSISHAQARAQQQQQQQQLGSNSHVEPTASYQPHIHAQWIPGGAQVAANASMSQQREDPAPSNSTAFGLKSFFESARSGPAGSSSGGSAQLRSSPTSSPAQRPLNSQALNSNHEYLTLPLRADSILSPLRTFDSLAQSPAASPAASPSRQHYREPPMSPNSPSKPPPAAIAAAAAFLARPMSPTAKPAQVYTYGSALGASLASQQQQPAAASAAPSSSVFNFAQASTTATQQPPVQRTLAWGSAAVSPARSAAPSQAPSVASSPMHQPTRQAPPPAATSSTAAAPPSSFHARNFPSSPSSQQQQQQQQANQRERSYHPHPAPSVAPSSSSMRSEQPLTASHLASSPISPRHSAALQAAHNALEQQRDRQRQERVAAAAVAAEASRERVQRERERLARLNSHEESKQSYQPAASPRITSTPHARPSSAATPSSYAPASQHQQQPHHRTLFSDQPEGQPSVPSTPSSYGASTHQQQQPYQRQSSSNLYSDRAPPSSSSQITAPPSARGGGGSRSFSPPPLSRMASPRAPAAAAAGAGGAPRSFGGLPLEEADFLDDDANLANILFNTQEISLDGEEDEEEGAAAAAAAEAEDEGAASSAAASFYASASSAAGSNNAGATSKIRVAVRKRPLNARERARNESDITSVTGPTGPTSPSTRSSLANHSANSVTIHEPKVKVDLTKFVESHSFHFDCAFGSSTSNGAIYQRLVQPLVGFVMAGQGGRASCFAYGQTGAGKTHTLMGPEGGRKEQSGLYMLAAEDIFRTLRDRQLEEHVAKSRAGGGQQKQQQSQPAGLKYAHCSLFVSFFEIYSGRLFDLLHSRSKLVCRTDSNDRVHVVGLREKKVTDVAQLLDVITQGNKQRSTGQTGANVDSSRSHAILSISLKQIVPMAPAEVGRRAPLHQPTPDPSDPSASPTAAANGASVFGSIVPGGGRGGGQFRLKTVGKLSFIDLAGSERGADTAETDRRTRTEGAEINKSLLALKECWRALDQGGRHLPFRGSILTQVLKDSFVGNSRTVMIAAIAPGSASCEHTLNTLRYADRVKSLRRGAPISAMSVEQAAAATPAAAAAAAASSNQFDRSSSAAAASGSGGKTARGGSATDRSGSSSSASVSASSAFGNAPAVVDAYMPYQGRKLNTKITLMPPSAAASSEANSGSPQRRGQLHGSASSGQLSVQSSPSIGTGMRSARGSSAQPASARGVAASTPSAAAPPAAAAAPAAESASALHARHRDLCARILLEEESLVLHHRSSIDAHMGGVKAELELLREFDGMSCSVDAYARQLKAMLRAKARAVQQLTDELDAFTAHLKEEEQMSVAVKRAQTTNGF